MREPNIVVERSANWLSENWMRLVMMAVVATSALTLYRYQFGVMLGDIEDLKKFRTEQQQTNSELRHTLQLTQQLLNAQVQATYGLQGAIEALQDSARALEATAARLDERTKNMQSMIDKEKQR